MMRILLRLLDHYEHVDCVNASVDEVYEVLRDLTQVVSPNIHGDVVRFAEYVCKIRYPIIHRLSLSYDKDFEYYIAKRHHIELGLTMDDLDRIFKDYPYSWAKILMRGYYHIIVVDNGEKYIVLGFRDHTSQHLFAEILKKIKDSNPALDYTVL